MNDDLPFAVEYAKSGRASCKKCKENIAKDSLRMAIMIQSHLYDGKMPLWHHLRCFFQKKTALKSIDEISNFANLRWDDQENIKKHLTGDNANSSKSQSTGNTDFSVEYAKSNRSSCKICGEKIQKGCIRVSKLSEGIESARFGPHPLWHHVNCFAEKKDELNYNDSADQLSGFDKLSDEDKQLLNEKIGTHGIKRKAENEGKPANEVKKKASTREDHQLKVQNEMLFKMRDELKKNLNKKQMIELLEYNNQHICTGEQRLLEHLSDCMVFGALKECPECKSDRPRFLENTYKCPGNLTEWTRCQYETRLPDREKFKISSEYKEDYVFLQEYKSKVQERRFPKGSESDKIKKKLPLHDYKVFILGKFGVSKAILTKKIEELGGSVSKALNLSVDFCISTTAEVESKSKKIQELEKLNIHVVSYAFIEEVKKGSPVAYSMKQALLCSWGGDPIAKFGIKQEHGSKKKEKEEESFKSVSHKVKVTVKGPAAVDPDSGLDASCHVFQHKKDIYNTVLVMVDMGKGTNSFYKLQLLQSNKGSKYHIFRQWGRVGTSVGGKKVEQFSDKDEAMSSFENVYLEKTGNEWVNRHNFVKKPGRMYPMEIDYGEESKKIKELKPGDNSKLPKSVQELICLIFDIEAMKKAMLEFEIDLKKMPLGKLSRKQIEQAYKVLSEAQQVLITGCNKSKIMDVSNRFYTLIPHDFGLKAPPLLDHEEIIKSKIEMLDSLLEIEIAYNLLQGETSSYKDPVDEHYEKLKTDIDILPKKSEEYKNIQTYIQNTHAATHNYYDLKLQEVFKINRHGENDRYQAYKDLHNKKLLWHGSRLTNFVGILSQGLRIAPPEAPVSGYMFGKGIYFADMVSKSANYCCTTKKNSTGILLLCEVALGNMYERTNAEFVTKLPKDKHSTMGMGQTIPDPSISTKIGDVEIPYGKPLQSGVNSCLLYNEYIVYDINQVNIKYLLKVDFKWKS